VTDNGDGTYTATLSSTSVGSATVSATINGSSVSNTANVSFTAGAANDANSELSVASNAVSTDSSTTVTVQAKDANGNNLTSGGDTVVISSTFGSVSAVTDNGDGTYTATLTSTTTGSATVSASLNGGTVGNVANINFVPGAVSETTTQVTVDASSITADGSSTTTVRVQARDANGNDLSSSAGTLVLSSSVGSISNIVDNGDGSYAATFTSSTTSGDAIISGSINGNSISDTTTVSLQAGAASGTTTQITADASSITADGTSTTTVRVSAIDVNGNNLSVSGGTLVLSTDLGSLSSVTDNGDGTYQATLTSTSATGNATISGTINGDTITDTALVEFDSGSASGLTTTIESDDTSLVADGVSTTFIRVQALDPNGNALVAGGDDVLLSTSAGSLSAVVDNGDGSYQATLTAATSNASVTISGTLNGNPISDTAELSFVTGDVDLSNTSFTFSENSLLADGSSTSEISIQLFDANGNPLSSGGHDVVLSTSIGELSSVVDNGDGSYTAIYTAPENLGGAAATAELDLNVDGSAAANGDIALQLNPNGDEDGDGLTNAEEGGADLAPQDSDGDGIANFLDPDDDGDGINTLDEGCE